MSLTLTRSNWQDMAHIGTCIHNIFAIYQPGSSRNEANALRVIHNFGFNDTLGNIAAQIVGAIDGLYQYLTTHYGPAESIEKELPFYHASGKHIIHGEMDMVWNYHKGILGERTQTYVPQLRAYKQALEAGNHPVEDCLIFYAVQGSIAVMTIE